MNNHLTDASKQELIARIEHLQEEIEQFKNRQKQTGYPYGDEESSCAYCRSIIDYADFGVVIISNDEIVYVNNFGTQLSGYSKQEIMNMDTEQRLHCIHQDFRKLLHKNFQSFFLHDADSLKISFKAIRKNGEQLWLRCTAGKEKKHSKTNIILTFVDISDNMEDIENLHYQSAIYNSLFDAIITTSLEFKIQSINKAAIQLYGWYLDEIKYKDVHEVFRIDFMDAGKQQIHKKLFDTGYWQGETIQYNKNHDKLYVLVSISLVKNSDNLSIGICFVNQDITTRKKYESELERYHAKLEELVHERTVKLHRETEIRKNILEKLKTSQSILNSVFNAFPVELMAFNEKNKLFLQNSQSIDNFGYHVGKSFMTINAFDTKNYEQEYEQVMNGQIVKYDVLRNSSDGKSHFYYKIIAPVFVDSSVVNIVILHIDITNRKKRENRIKYQANILENVSDAIISVDNSLKIVTWNASSEKMLGYSFDEAYGEVFSDFLKLRYLQASPSEVLNSVLNDKKWQGEVILVTKQGKDKFFEASLSPLYDEFSEQIGIVGINHDITERKKMEIQLKNVNKRLRCTLEKEREINKIKSEFISIASHQFRTPLTTIQSSIELLQLYATSVDEEVKKQFRKHHQRIISEIDRLNDLMNDVLILGRIDAGKTPFAPQKTDIKKYIEEMINEHLRDQYPERNILIHTTGTPVPVFIDKKLMYHVLINILTNSIKYSEKEIDISIEYAEQQLQISITDYGIGIDHDDQPYIFQSFYRGKNTNEIQGSGLGLSIAKQFIDTHNGTIELSSKPGKETKFVISIPYTQQNQIIS